MIAQSPQAPQISATNSIEAVQFCKALSVVSTQILVCHCPRFSIRQNIPLNFCRSGTTSHASSSAQQSTLFATTPSGRRIIQYVSKSDALERIRFLIPKEVLTLERRATELTVQSERAFQKQPHIFQNSKVKAKSARPGKGGRRWYKDVGLGFRTPKTAIEGSYIGT